jgi:N-acetylglucosaminyl-diphospho-decaprenol L-rhamnosyltransferase
VIVAYRSAAHLVACLDAIDADRGTSDRSIVVVDNDSPDESGDVAAGHRSHPVVLRLQRNVGFGAGCNAGAGVVAADALLFVNPDARIGPGAGDRLLAELQSDARIAVVGASVVPGRGAEAAGAEPSARSAIGHFLFAGRVGPLRRLFPPLQLRHGSGRADDVDWVGGAAMMVRRLAFDQVGGFDERLFLYMEDVDLCRRLRQHGWRIRFAPDAAVDHDLGGSQGPEQAERWYRAFDAYVRRTHGPVQARVAAAAAATGMGLRALVYRLAGLPGADRMGRGARAALGCLVSRVPVKPSN